MVLTKNQLYLLKLLDLAGEIEGKTRLQKIMFLAETEEKAPIDYSFEKYHYGPFSFDLSDDLDAMVKTNFIHEEKSGFPASDGKILVKSTFSLTSGGKKTLQEQGSILEGAGIQALTNTLGKWSGVSLDKILTYVYAKYMNDDTSKLTIT